MFFNHNRFSGVILGSFSGSFWGYVEVIFHGLRDGLVGRIGRTVWSDGFVNWSENLSEGGDFFVGARRLFCRRGSDLFVGNRRFVFGGGRFVCRGSETGDLEGAGLGVGGDLAGAGGRFGGRFSPPRQKYFAPPNNEFEIEKEKNPFFLVGLIGRVLLKRGPGPT